MMCMFYVRLCCAMYILWLQDINDETSLLMLFTIILLAIAYSICSSSYILTRTGS